MPQIIDHTFHSYQRKWASAGPDRYNGAYYYCQEILDGIIPYVETDRNWVLLNIQTYGFRHSIVFIHNNVDTSRYAWLREYGNDHVLVCGVPQTVEKVAHLGKAVYLPLSIDTEYVKQFKLSKDERHGTCYVGRPEKLSWYDIPGEADVLTGMPREELLPKLARYEKAYAVGRCALEAKCLGLEILPYDPRYPDPSLWKVSDTSTAARRLQKILDRIDG